MSIRNISYDERSRARQLDKGTGSVARNTRRYNRDPYPVGRCGSAPPVADSDLLTTITRKGIKYFENLSTRPWRSADDKIRLAYRNLVSSPLDSDSQMQGIVLDPPKGVILQGQLQSHFSTLAVKMVGAHSDKDLTECTGEAAAALYMAKHYPAHEMVWGIHIHSGAGIDQIWVKKNPAFKHGYEEIIIVEAKGIGATLRTDNTIPNKLGVQMSLNWVIDRLGRMQASSLAKDLLKALDLTVKQQRFLAGSSTDKNFWVVDRASGSANSSNVTLRGLVLEAKWNSNLQLSAHVRKQIDYQLP